VGDDGIEPTQRQRNRFTVCPDSPTSAITQYKIFKLSVL